MQRGTKSPLVVFIALLNGLLSRDVQEGQNVIASNDIGVASVRELSSLGPKPSTRVWVTAHTDETSRLIETTVLRRRNMVRSISKGRVYLNSFILLN